MAAGLIAVTVAIWQGELPDTEESIAACAALLSPDERLAAETFKNAALQRRFVLVRGMVRQVLASYLLETQNCASLQTIARELQFGRGDAGKPFLLGLAEPLFFNLSHTGNHLLIAVSSTGEVGVDIEQHQQRRSFIPLAERCFSANELNYWQALPKAQQLPAFYRLWTAKEAFVKATGRGIALGLQQCEVDCQSFARFNAVPAVCGAAGDWALMSLPVAANSSAALVTAGKIARVDCFELDEVWGLAV